MTNFVITNLALSSRSGVDAWDIKFNEHQRGL